MRDERTEQQRRITHLLADAELLFALSRAEGFGPVWTIRFDLPDRSKVEVNLTVDETFLTVSHVEAAAATLDPASLLRLNARVAMAKVCLQETGELAVAAQVPLSHVDLESLRMALGNVLTTIVETRKLASTQVAP